MRSSHETFAPLSVAPPIRPPARVGLAMVAVGLVAYGLCLGLAGNSLGAWGLAAVLGFPLGLLTWQFGTRAGLVGGLLGAGAGGFLAFAWANGAPWTVLISHASLVVAVGSLGRLRDLRVEADHEWVETARARRQLQQRQAQAEALLSALPDTTIRLDRQGNLRGASGGRDLPNFVPRTIEDVVPLRAAETIRSRARAVLDTGRPAQFEYDVAVGDRVLDYEVRLAASGPSEVLGILRDVTQRKRLERELIGAREAALETARMKTKFIANMSHEIRTPMNGVIGMAHLLRETELSREQSEYVEIIYKSGNALLEIIDDILDFAKIEAGKMQLDSVDFDLRACLYESVEAFAGQAFAKDLELGTLLSPGVPRRASGDPTRLRQVLANLLSNAVRFTDTGDVLLTVELLSQRESSQTLRFSVRDTGLGLNETARRHLFKPLLLGEKAGEQDPRRGTGLGLAICHELVQLMGGEIGVESHTGKGSTFWFTASLGTTFDSNSGEGLLPPDPRGVRVLLVQSSARRRLLAEQLRSFGALPEVASGDEAVVRLLSAEREGWPFEAVIVDMPRDAKTALGCVEAIRAEPSLRDLPLMAVDSPEVDSTYRADLRRAVGRMLGWTLRHDELLGALTAALGRAHDEPARRSQSAEMPVLGEPLALGARVLVAEDNEVNRRVAERTLQRLGCESVCVADGCAAVSLALEEPFDIILMDCQMPTMDGYEATREIRRRRQDGHHVPIIAMTANNTKGERERCLAAHMDDFLCKPVTMPELRAALERWVPRTQGGTVRAPGPAPPQSELEVPVGDPLEAGVFCQLELLGGGDPEFVVELIDLFMDQTPRHLEAMQASLAVGDVQAVAKTAHTMKSSAGYLGALGMGELCRVVEAKGREGDVPGLTRGVEALHAEYERVQKALLVERERLRAT